MTLYIFLQFSQDLLNPLVIVCNLKSAVPNNPDNGPLEIYKYLLTHLLILFIYETILTSVPSIEPLTSITFDIVAPNVER